MFTSALGADYALIRDKTTEKIMQRFSFSSARKRMNTLLWLDESKSNIRMYVKVEKNVVGLPVTLQGAPEILLRRCNAILNPDGKPEELTAELRERLGQEIDGYAERGLRTLCLAYRDMPAPTSDKVVSLPEVKEVLFFCCCLTKHKQEEEEGFDQDLSHPPFIVMDPDTQTPVFHKAPDNSDLVAYAILGIHVAILL